MIICCADVYHLFSFVEHPEPTHWNEENFQALKSSMNDKRVHTNHL